MLCTPHIFPRTQAGQQVFAANALGAPQIGASVPTVTSGQVFQTHFFRIRTPLLPLRNLRLRFPGWTPAAGNVSTEVATGNTIAVRARLKLMRVPSEVERTVLFSGNATGTVPSGGVLVSDALVASPGVIPSGTEVWVCVESEVAAGGVRPGGIGGRRMFRYNGATPGGHQALAFTDIPWGEVGDFTGQTATYSCFAMTAETVEGRTISVLLHGDSISRGGDDTGDGFGNSGAYQRGLYQLGYPYAMVGVAGSNPQQATGDANYANRATLMPFATTHLTQHGHNSAYGSAASWGALSGVLPNWWNYLRTKRNVAIVQTVIGPRPANGSPDNWATLANQTDGSGGLPDPLDGSSPQNPDTAGVRWRMNDQIRGKVFPLTGFIDIGGVWSDPNEAHKYRVSGQGVPFWFTTDGSHVTNRAAEAAVPVMLAGARLFA
jgi:hypothetical protein